MLAARYINYYKLYRNIRGAGKFKNLLIFRQVRRYKGKRKISKDKNKARRSGVTRKSVRTASKFS